MILPKKKFDPDRLNSSVNFGENFLNPHSFDLKLNDSRITVNPNNNNKQKVTKTKKKCCSECSLL